MEAAVFSLVDYNFPKVTIDFPTKSDSRNLNVRFSPKGLYDEKTGVYELSFAFDGNLDENDNPVINIVCNANFKFNNKLSKNDIPEYFYRNCIAIMFPYIRAFVSTVTLQANIPPVILPTYNLSSLSNELFNNTEFK